MNARFIIRIALLLALLHPLHAAETAIQPDTSGRPNFLVIVVDDLGLNEVSCFLGRHYRTPAIDQLAGEGTRFTRAIVNPICSSTRALLVTGRYGYNTGIISNVGNVRGGLRMFLPDDTPTVASVLSRQGYDTAIMGKWHLHWKSASNPLDVQHKGFRRSFIYVGETGHPDHAEESDDGEESGGKLQSQFDQVFWKDGKNVGKVKGYSTDVLTDQAIEFLASENTQPFLLWMTYFAVHAPFEAPEKYLAMHPETEELLASAKLATEQGRKRGLGENYKASPMQLRLRRAMVSSLDDNLGRLFAALKKTKHGRNTVVIFISDNGAHPVVGGGKATLTDSGVRVPLIIKDPRAKNPAQSVPLLVEGTDIVPTILDYAGIAPAPGSHDGRSLVPLLRGDVVNPAAWRPTAFAQMKSGIYLTDGAWFANTTVKSDAEEIRYYRSEESLNPNAEQVRENDVPASVRAKFERTFSEKRAAWWVARNQIFSEHPECVPATTRSEKNVGTARAKADATSIRKSPQDQGR